jgi:hypothetical protein
MAAPWAVRRFGQPPRRPTGSALSQASRGSVAVGDQTRYAREHQGSVAVGDQTRWAREHPVGAPPTIGPAGVPSPSSPQSLFAKLPPSRYNPERLTLAEESERGLGQLEGNIGTKVARGTGDYTTNLAELERNRGISGQNHQTALSNLARAFQRLGVTQAERQNQAGVLPGGGAALQAAQKRLANEQREAGVENTRYGRENEGYDNAAARLSREYGRSQEDLNNELTNARANNEFYGTSQERLAAREASDNGYYEPEGEPSTGGTPAGKPPARKRGAHTGRSAFAAARRKARL